MTGAGAGMEKNGNPVADVGGHSTMQSEARRWLLRITSGEATAADAEALKQWCAQSPSHARAFAEANLLWDNVEAAAQLPSAVASFQAASLGQPRHSRRWVLGAMTATAAAGAFAVYPPFGLWPSLPELGADYRTRTAERRDIAMPDGVSIELNTRSSLNIVADQSGQQIQLVAGEAAISCPSRPAQSVAVSAGGGVVRAAGAQFNIRSDSAGSVVTCRRGVVALDYAEQSVSVGEGHQASYADGRVGPVVAVEAAAVMAWREGQLVFRQTPLAEVVAEVNRYRNGRIVLINEALGRRPVEAKIPIDRVDSLIALVQQAYGAKVTWLPGAIVVIS